MLLEGIFAPLTTPFHADGRLFRGKLAQNVEHYSRAPLAGMLVLDEAGEGDGLTDAEAEEVLATAIAAAANEKVMLASVGRDSVHATLRLAKVAAAAGYDAILVRVPRSLDPSSLAIEGITYFRTLADSASVPVILADEPGRELGVGAVSELAQHPNILGLLERGGDEKRVAAIKAATATISREALVTTVFAPATGRMLRASASGGSFVSAASLGGGAATAVESRPSLKTRIKKVSFQVLTGKSSGMLGAWQASASGSIARFAACAPQATCEVWQAFRDGDLPLAEEKQERLRSAAGLVEGSAGISVLKYACDWNGYYGGRPRLPLLAPAAYARTQIEEALAGMRN